MKNELSQKEQAALDRKMERLATKIEKNKQNYDELMSQYAELFALRYPEKTEKMIKDALYNAYRVSDKSLEQVIDFMAGDFDEDM